jgi:hypothetical protein
MGVPDEDKSLADHAAKIGRAGRASKHRDFDFPPAGGER